MISGRGTISMSSEKDKIWFFRCIAPVTDVEGLCSSMTLVAGPGRRFNAFEEKLKFTPEQTVGNMNFNTSPVEFLIRYEGADEAKSSTCLATYLGSPIDGGSTALSCELPIAMRNVLLGRKYRAIADHAEAGVRFEPRIAGMVVDVFRVFDAEIRVQEGHANWQAIGGNRDASFYVTVTVSCPVHERTDKKTLAEKFYRDFIRPLVQTDFAIVPA